MTIEYISTFEDYKAGQALYLRSRRRAALRYKLWMYGLPTLSILLTAGAVWNIYTRQARDGGVYGVLAAYSILLTIVVVLLRPWNLKRLYKKQRKLNGVENLSTVMFAFDDTLVRSGYPGRSEGQFTWESIVDYAEDETVFLLFISQKMFLYIPKRAMSGEQWQEFREMLQAKGKQIAC